jgi:hypothetical protein
MNPPDTAHRFDNFERLKKMIQRYGRKKQQKSYGNAANIQIIG